jgi:hypothetical protein
MITAVISLVAGGLGVCFMLLLGAPIALTLLAGGVIGYVVLHDTLVAINLVP